MDIQFNSANLKWIKGSHGLPELVLKIKIPSVTAIINEIVPDPDFEKFVEQVGKEKADQIMTSAGNRGSATHIFVENFLSQYSKTKNISEALKYTQEESPKLLEAEKIPKDKIEEGRNLFYKFYYSEYSNRYSDIIALEMGIYSPSLFYRGKLDIFYKDKVYGYSITDFKSSNGKIKKGSVKEEKYFLQLGGYTSAVEQMYSLKNLKINYASILCLDKQSEELQEIVLAKEQLELYKQKFETICRDYHKIKKTSYLLEKN